METPHNNHYRKIELQCPADLTYLMTNIKKAAQEKIDLAIPPPPPPPPPPGQSTGLQDAGQQQQQQQPEQEPDMYRIRVEELVMEYIQETLAIALPSLSINGLPVSPSSYLRTASSSSTTITTNTNNAQDPNDPFTDAAHGNEDIYEPYDPRLAERLRALHAQLEDEQTKVAELRREAPALAASAYADVLRRAVERDRIGAVAPGEAPSGGTTDEKPVAEVVEKQLDLGAGLQRRKEVEAMYSRAVAGLVDLGEITGVLARLERAEKAAAVVLGDKEGAR